MASIKASFSAGFNVGATGGHADGGIFTHEHIARFAEGGKPEAVIPLDISKRSQGMSILGQVQELFGLGDIGEMLGNMGGGGLMPAYAFAGGGGGDAPTQGGGSPSFNFSGINFSFGSDIDEEELAIAIGRRFLDEIKQGQENRG